jgi:hypothetical protein
MAKSSSMLSSAFETGLMDDVILNCVLEDTLLCEELDRKHMAEMREAQEKTSRSPPNR